MLREFGLLLRGEGRAGPVRGNVRPQFVLGWRLQIHRRHILATLQEQERRTSW